MNAIKFPVIDFSEDFIDVIYSLEELTTWTRVGLKHLKRRNFMNMKIVDSNYQLFEIKEAKKIKGIGPFWGWNVFLNQKIKVELIFKETTSTITLPDLKKMIFDSLKKSEYRKESWGFKELVRNVRNAKDISGLIKALS